MLFRWKITSIPARKTRRPPSADAVLSDCTMDPVNTLVQAMGQCRVLDPAQVEEVRQTLLPRYASEPRGLAGELLNRDWVTPFQLNRLFAGRGPGFLQGSYVLLERIGEGGLGQV